MNAVKPLILAVLISLITNPLCAQKVSSAQVKKDIQGITNMLMQQTKDWSAGDLEAFMNGYIKSDKLYFVGRSGLTSGWAKTLANYKKGYPTTDHTGTLKFDLEKFEPLAPNVYLVIGQFHLKRKVGDADGWFSLILKRIDGEWKIIADHSS
ncbi:DUF4440 domain-containing protein [Flavobacteriaceae bacterium F08102]|nr:DUF4440 domain-containing protein [Flavobacteriaceae bacterium F08102]